jgi:hypothetical protein
MRKKMAESTRADIVSTLRFYKTENGGRKGPTPRDKFQCIINVDEHNFDVRMYLDEIGGIWPGQTAQVPMRFLSPALAGPYCSVGTRFLLREGKVIGEGTIEQVNL